MRAALDTNVLAYAEGVNGARMRKAALRLLGELPPEAVVAPVQALSELFHVLARKAGRTPAEAHAAVLSWHNAFRVAEISSAVLLAAADLAVAHRLGIWDAVVICAAAGCQLLLSEDRQDGFIWKGVTLANRIARPRHPLLAAMTGSSA